MLVRDYMKSDSLFVRPETSLDELKEIAESCHLHELPVVGTDGRLLGVVGHRELLRATLDRAHAGAVHGGRPGPSAAEIMRRAVVVAPEASIHDAARQLLAERSGCLMVVQDGRFLGTLGDHDLLAAAHGALAAAR